MVGYPGWQRRNEYLLESGETSLRQVVEEIEPGREIGKLIICLRIVRCYPELNVNVKSYGFEHEDDGEPWGRPVYWPIACAQMIYVQLT
jgi:hypothetical protein